MLRARLHVVPLLGLAIQLALSLPTGLGLVLCVGADGHVAVERGDCGDETPAVPGDCDEFGASLPCTDTPLTCAELPSGSQLRAGADDGLLALVPFALEPVAPAPASTRWSSAPPNLPAFGGSRGRVLRL